MDIHKNKQVASLIHDLGEGYVIYNNHGSIILIDSGYKISRYYDKFGNHIKTFRHSTNSFFCTNEYDQFGNKVIEINPMGKTEYEYDQFGNMTEKDDNNGITFYKYDQFGNQNSYMIKCY